MTLTLTWPERSTAVSMGIVYVVVMVVMVIMMRKWCTVSRSYIYTCGETIVSFVVRVNHALVYPMTTFLAPMHTLHFHSISLGTQTSRLTNLLTSRKHPDDIQHTHNTCITIRLRAIKAICPPHQMLSPSNCYSSTLSEIIKSYTENPVTCYFRTSGLVG